MHTSITLPSIFPVTCHTDYVGVGTTFVAIQGFSDDGVRYIPLAIEKGATTIVVGQTVELEPAVADCIEQKCITLMRVENTRKALAELSAYAAGNPSQFLKLIGITGTKGKSTTTFLLDHILQTAGYTTALLSTVKNKIDTTEFVAPLTTAQPDYLHQFFKVCVENKVTHVVMEVAAQAMTMHRVNGLYFDGIIFTNFSREHLEFYQSLEDYFAAKTALLEHLKLNAPVVVNGDDIWCNQLLPIYYRFGLYNKDAYYKATVSHSVHQLETTVTYEKKATLICCPPLRGEYNVYNVLAATSMALLLGIELSMCAYALSSFTGVPGRFEQYKLNNGSVCIIDCAHNPSSYTALLSTLRSLTDHLIVVFGAGGQRDPGRRPQMGAIAGTLCDWVIVTSDNPRNEDPSAIIQQIVEGIAPSDMHKVVIELDRYTAIHSAYALSRANSIIALLGKADADYQIIGTQKIPFSERAIIKELQY